MNTDGGKMSTYSGGNKTKAFLIIQRGNDIGTRVDLSKRQTTIGRNADNDIVLNNPMISRYHAVIQHSPETGQVAIIDLGSTNGVIVNDSQIEPGVPFLLQQRDSILIGTSIFNLQLRAESHNPVRPRPREEDPDITQYLELPRLFS
jgi:pSer/pThr/pTyr-binding forkhead associated (FHA) protein